MENDTRHFVIKRLATLLEIPEESTICINIEKCILNHAADRARQMGAAAAWDNHKYSNIYKHKFFVTSEKYKRESIFEGKDY